jgi:hypothetical protein
MTRLFARCTLCLLIVASLTILLIHASPYDDHDLRRLPVVNCQASCFMGIYPGITTLRDATHLLTTHPWVSQVTAITKNNSDQLLWTWSDKAPSFLRSAAANPTFYAGGRVVFDKGIVANINFDTHLTFGDIALAWRYPDESQLVLPGLMIKPDSSILAIVNIAYQNFRVNGILDCPYTTHIWQTPVHISVVYNINTMPVVSIRPMDIPNFLGSIRRTTRLMCSRQF